MDKTGQKRRKKRIWMVLAAMCLVCTASGIWYVNDYYRAEDIVETYFEPLASAGGLQVTKTEKMVFIDSPGTEHAVIFYPGAKVEFTAYLPLFYALAEQGMDCFLLKMPANLAILGSNAAERVMEEYEYPNWYLAGHSLGGAMAAGFAADHREELGGLILLAAYPTKNLTGSDLNVISIYGSEDLVLNRENLSAGRTMMPETYTEVEIVGGNHAWFGYYGEQEGDGTATITKEEQQQQAADIIISMLHLK